MDYEQCVRFLEEYQAERGNRLPALLEALGRPDRDLRGILVTGTNGKGSVAAFAVSALTALGLRTGSMPSPHLQERTERIRIDGIPVTPLHYAAAVTEVVAAQEATGVRFTRAALGAAAAAVHFRTAAVDVAVVEATAGGRSAAIAAFELGVQVLTGVALDHVGILGDTLYEIADEKAGAVRDGDHLVLGPLPPPARAAVRDVLAERSGVSVWELGTDVQVRASRGTADGRVDVRTPRGDHYGLPCPLPGPHQHRNLALAVAAVDTLVERGTVPAYDDERLLAGLAATVWPGRLERVGPLRVGEHRVRVLLDGAHNPDAMAAVMPEIRRSAVPTSAAPASGRPPAVVLALGRGHGKQADAMLEPLPSDWPLVVTQVPGRAKDGDLTVDELRARAAATARAAPTYAEPDVAAALHRAAALAAPDGLVVVVGSLALVGRARTLLGLPPA